VSELLPILIMIRFAISAYILSLRG